MDLRACQQYIYNYRKRVLMAKRQKLHYSNKQNSGNFSMQINLLFLPIFNTKSTLAGLVPLLISTTTTSLPNFHLPPNIQLTNKNHKSFFFFW